MISENQDCGPKAFSEFHSVLNDGTEIVVMYDCKDSRFQKAYRRWKSKGKLTGERLCIEVKKIDPHCIAVTRQQFLEVLKEEGITEEEMGKQYINTRLDGLEN